jgi:hypothetical protein
MMAHAQPVATGGNARRDEHPNVVGTKMQTIAFAAEEAGVRLSVTVDGGTKRQVVLNAQGSGSGNSLERRVLDRLCKIIEGRPLQEAAEHGVIYTLEALAEDCAPVTGIRTPRNAGPAFALAERLIRRIHASAREHFQVDYRENGWYTNPSAEWLAASEAEQAGNIKPILADLLCIKGLTENDAWICRIERGTRVTISFGDAVSYALKPGLIMELERRLRLETENPLELFMDEMKDSNKIRRL